MSLDLSALAEAALAGSALGFEQRGVRAELSLYRSAAAEVVAHGRLTGALGCVCSRCAGPAAVTLGADLSATYVPAGRLGREKQGKEIEMDADVADLFGYKDEEIDLEPMLREQILLALPYAPLCRESCKGLCPRCGAELDKGPCDCAAETDDRPVDHRWDALKNVKL